MKATDLFFSLLVSIINFCVAQNPSFHHFWLVQMWPPGYCLQVHCYRFPSTFMLHGLWPVSYNDITIRSRGSNISKTEILEAVENDETLNTDMLRYWRSLVTRDDEYLPNFWIHEWETHGSAQRLHQPLDYFRRAIELTKNTNLLSTLNARGILANGSIYPKVEYRKAILRITGHTPILRCVSNGNVFTLKEVVICVDSQARNFIKCNKLKIGRESCNGTSIKFPAPIN